MIAYAIALLVNFPQTKTQNKKIKELGQNAMVMTVTLFSVGIFMGVISGTGMVDAMATTIGDHIKYSLKFVWPMSILTLIASTLLGVIPF